MPQKGASPYSNAGARSSGMLDILLSIPGKRDCRARRSGDLGESWVFYGALRGAMRAGSHDWRGTRSPDPGFTE